MIITHIYEEQIFLPHKCREAIDASGEIALAFPYGRTVIFFEITTNEILPIRCISLDFWPFRLLWNPNLKCLLASNYEGNSKEICEIRLRDQNWEIGAMRVLSDAQPESVNAAKFNVLCWSLFKKANLDEYGLIIFDALIQGFLKFDINI